MAKILHQQIIKDAKTGGFIGIGISLVLTISTGSLSTNPLHWLSSIVFGFLVGFLICAGNELVINIFFRIFPNYNKSFIVFLYYST
jgi:hypothetical protein